LRARTAALLHVAHHEIVEFTVAVVAAAAVVVAVVHIIVMRFIVWIVVAALRKVLETKKESVRRWLVDESSQRTSNRSSPSHF
jgi:hypothetical protein